MQTTGQIIKEAQLALFESRDKEFLAECRAVAVQICQEFGTVSINDIRQRVAIPAEMHPSVLGAVFRNKQFEACGFTEATHAQAHARVVRVYKLASTKEH